jgi:hypothetical protein
MRRIPKDGLAGFVNAEVHKTAAGIRLMLNTFIRSSEAFAVIRCFDRNERAIVGNDGKPLTLCNIEMSLTGPRPIPFGLRYQRPRQIFGRYSQFYHDSILVDVPKICGLRRLTSNLTYSQGTCIRKYEGRTNRHRATPAGSIWKCHAGS